MAAANPENLKKPQELSRRDVVFALARMPATSRLFFGTSEFKGFDVDLSQPKPEPKGLGGHSSYVTGVALAGNVVVSGGYDGRLIWWDTEQHSQSSAVDGHHNTI